MFYSDVVGSAVFFWMLLFGMGNIGGCGVMGGVDDAERSEV